MSAPFFLLAETQAGARRQAEAVRAGVIPALYRDAAAALRSLAAMPGPERTRLRVFAFGEGAQGLTGVAHAVAELALP